MGGILPALSYSEPKGRFSSGAPLSQVREAYEEAEAAGEDFCWERNASS